MKKIESLKSHPFHVDQVGRAAAVFVNGNGNIFLDEGNGPNTWNGAVLRRVRNPRFALRDQDGPHLWIEYGSMEFHLGEVLPEAGDPEAWVAEVNAFLGSALVAA